MVSGIALITGLVFWVIDNEAGFFVFLVMLLLIGLVALAWRVPAWQNHRQNIGGVREAFVTKDAIYMNKKIHHLACSVHQLRWSLPTKHSRHTVFSFQLYVIKQTNWADNIYNPRAHSAGQEEAAKNLAGQINLQNGY